LAFIFFRPLYHAGSYDALLLLLRCGADVDTTDDHGRTPLFRLLLLLLLLLLFGCQYLKCSSLRRSRRPHPLQIMLHGAPLLRAPVAGLGR
jgi:hypothetical protein